MKFMFNNNQVKHVNFNGTKIKKVFYNGVQIYSSGTNVTYHVSETESYMLEVDEGKSVLIDPQKRESIGADWTFLGWRTDTTASEDVLTNRTALEDTLDLYAVWYKNVTVTKYNGSNTASTETKKYLFNNANYSSPSFVLSENALSGWSAAGWTTSASGYSATIANGGSVTLSSNATYYSLYTQTITLTYYDYGTAAQKKTGTRIANIHNATTYSNPTITVPAQRAVSAWVGRGWSTSNTGNAGISYAASTNYSFDSNVTIYSLYQRTVTVSYAANGGSGSIAASTGTAYLNASGTPVNASIALRSNTFTAPNSDMYANGWNIASPYVGYSDTTATAVYGTYAATAFNTLNLDAFPFPDWTKTPQGSASSDQITFNDYNAYSQKTCYNFIMGGGSGTAYYGGYVSKSFARNHCTKVTFKISDWDGYRYSGDSRSYIKINGVEIWSGKSTADCKTVTYNLTNADRNNANVTITLGWTLDTPTSGNRRFTIDGGFAFS